MIQVKELDKSFKKKRVLQGISLSMDKGLYGLLGENGAGKTTLLRCILNLQEPSGGQVLIQSPDATVGYLPQKFGVFKELTVYEQLEYFCAMKNIPKVKIKEDIDHVIDLVNLQDQTHTRASKLSGGMLRRLGIAQALLGNPDIIIFDEPTVGLDPEERIRFRVLLSKIKEERLVLISTHIIEDIESCCDRVVILHKGQILANDTLSDLKDQVKDKVYEVVGHVNSDYLIKQYQDDNKYISRILSHEQVGKRVDQVTLEDAYMYVVKGFEDEL